MSALYETLDLSVQAVVTETDKTIPLTGVYALDPVGGWVWDRRSLESLEDPETRYNTYLGGHSHGLDEATKQDWWQSGTNELEFIDTAEYRIQDRLSWTPRYTVGKYSVHQDTHQLYSDYSYAERFDPANDTNGVNTIELHTDCELDTITVSMYRRDPSLTTYHAVKFSRVDQFTGELVGSERLPTVVADEIVWANLAQRKAEWLVSDGSVWLNKQFQYRVGPPEALVLDSDREGFEPHGNGEPEGRDCFLGYFPVADGSVTVLVRRGGVLVEWTETTDINLSGSTDEHFEVDYDLGIVTIGGWKAPDVVLAQDINSIETTLNCYLDDKAFAQYPEYGIVWIGTEAIYYNGKGTSSFLECTRGYLGTTAEAYLKGVTVEDGQHGAGTLETDEIYIAYTATPLIQYEVTTHKARSANKSTWLNIKPSANIQTNNVVQITTHQQGIAEIILSTDAPLIGGNFYGPVYYGTDVARMTATALDQVTNPVDDVELTIEIFQGPGVLNGGTQTHTGMTNTLGDLYAIYNAPYSTGSLDHWSTLVEQDTGENLTRMTVPGLPPGIQPSEITVFQLLKHDRTQGTQGFPTVLDVVEAGDTDRGLGRVVIHHRVGEQYVGGTLYCLGSDAVAYYRTINYIYNYIYNDLPVSVLYLDEALPSGPTLSRPARLFEEEAVAWDWNELSEDFPTHPGLRVLLYEWSAGTQHPIANTLGAYIPVRPDSIEGDILTFENRLLPIPVPESTELLESNLATYLVVCPAVAYLYAYGKDPVSGRTIESNTVRLKIGIPVWLQGMGQTGELPIPYGFTFITEEFNIGAGLGGANFLTVNPVATGLNTFSIFAEVP